MQRPSGFTLVELLVVITIIIVLLALLTPALDQAIYQAELTQCGANLHAVGVAVTAYALDYKAPVPLPARRPSEVLDLARCEYRPSTANGFSRWQNAKKADRGPLDRNFLRADVSVARVTDITIDETRSEKRGLTKAPIATYGENITLGRFTTLPPD